MPQRSLPLNHALLALTVVAVWGSNFAMMKVALTHVEPLALAALRYIFVLLPAIFFVKRPQVPWRQLMAYGVLIGAIPFGILIFAMTRFIPPGLASLIMQTQVFFTIILSIVIERERVQHHQWLALALAAAGIGVIAVHTDGTTTTIAGVVMTLIAAVSWAGGNVVAKRSGRIDMLGYVVWASLFSVPPLVIASMIFEGPTAIIDGLIKAELVTWLVFAWQSFANALFGFAVWGWLLARHPAALIVPSALLVPVFGMGTAAMVLGEPLPWWKLTAAALVISGLGFNILWPQIQARLIKR